MPQADYCIRLFTLGSMLLLGLCCANPVSAQRAQQAPSIAASFDAFWAAARDRPFAEQEAIWDQVIEEPRGDVYASVVWEKQDHAHWKEQKERLLRERFVAYPGVWDQIPAAARNLQSDIPIQAKRLRAIFPEAPAHPLVQLVLAPNLDAKSGVLGNGTPVLVFAVDTLVLEHADMSIIFPHELFHLYHAEHAHIQNDGVMPGAYLTLPLFAEGLATYVSSVLSPGHSDGQLLLQNDLGELPVSRLPEIAGRFLADADQKAVDPVHPEAFARWFMGSKENRQPGLPNRAGYWLGLQVIRHIRQQHTLREVASWSASQAQVQARAALAQIAQGGPEGSGN
jgi:hypothetical protein